MIENLKTDCLKQILLITQNASKIKAEHKRTSNYDNPYFSGPTSFGDPSIKKIGLMKK